MRQIGFFLLASGLFLTGCIGNDSLGSSMSAQRNIDNLARISLGMSDREVFQIMRQPYRSEAFEIEGDRYEVWFYITRLLIMEQKEPTKVNLTPLVFRNGVLEGRGYVYYNKLVKEETLAETEAGQAPKEDYDLEKALTPPPGSKPGLPTKPVAPPAQPAKPPAKTKPSANKPAAKPKQQTPQSGQPSQTTPPSNQPVKQPFPLSQPGTQPAAPAQPGSQPASPTQPHATQPPAPTQPNSSPKPASSSQSNVTMSKPSSTDKPVPAEQNEKKPPKKENPKKTKKDNVPLTEEDENVLQEEREENFDFW